jgi:predicted alpha/beta-fold hydrolase
MTVVGNFVRGARRAAVRRERWELDDGDFLDVDCAAPRAAGAPIAIVCHGLEGSSEAHYVRGLMGELDAAGIGAVALNFRGCSGELNRLPRFYHSGETGDLAHVVERVAREHPKSPLALVGFSLGGNVVAKYLGERGAQLPSAVRAGAVISVPFDLALCARNLDGPGGWMRIYRERFLRRLRKKAIAKARLFPTAIDAGAARRARTIEAFDDAITAPLHGFKSAIDYYARASAGPLIGDVRVPLLVLAAEDDPLVPITCQPQPTSQVEVVRVPAGGHVAFLEGPPWKPRRWAESFIVGRLARTLGLASAS